MENRPIEFYLDDIELIAVTSSLNAVSTFPNKPAKPSLVGPGGATLAGINPDYSSSDSFNGGGSESTDGGNGSNGSTGGGNPDEEVKNSSGINLTSNLSFVVFGFLLYLFI
eukprot:TRINITY_DN34588_c0_g1_i1.p1 TRINITY_DN34588_c0_g1~~TRINITY_DN34588_c0_g1_i1.p1  ORF type:complete len:111 (+),score=36.45 TRINITY_DN34588_c0_g1_i1:361-693(+)